jgi:monoamine oxidase
LTVQALLAEMHQIPPDQMPDPTLPLVKDWAEDPFGAGWHFWRPTVNVAKTLPKVRQPIASIPVHICGEAYTNQQGWVEGALTSAEQLMQNNFSLQRPDWLKPYDYYLGP